MFQKSRVCGVDTVEGEKLCGVTYHTMWLGSTDVPYPDHLVVAPRGNHRVQAGVEFGRVHKAGVR